MNEISSVIPGKSVEEKDKHIKKLLSFIEKSCKDAKNEEIEGVAFVLLIKRKNDSKKGAISGCVLEPSLMMDFHNVLGKTQKDINKNIQKILKGQNGE